MPRKAFKPKKPEYVLSSKVVERKAKSRRRNGKPKLRVVAGTAAARALGIGR